MTGVTLQRVMELTEAQKLNAEVMTLLSGPAPEVCRASHSASVPDAQPTTAPTPRYSAESRSKLSNSEPPTKCWELRTRSIASATSFLMLSYWRLRSSIGTGSRAMGRETEEGVVCDDMTE